MPGIYERQLPPSLLEILDGNTPIYFDLHREAPFKKLAEETFLSMTGKTYQDFFSNCPDLASLKKKLQASGYTVTNIMPLPASMTNKPPREDFPEKISLHAVTDQDQPNNWLNISVWIPKTN